MAAARTTAPKALSPCGVGAASIPQWAAAKRGESRDESRGQVLSMADLSFGSSGELDKAASASAPVAEPLPPPPPPPAWRRRVLLGRRHPTGALRDAPRAD